MWAQYLSVGIYYKMGMKYLVWDSQQCEGSELRWEMRELGSGLVCDTQHASYTQHTVCMDQKKKAIHPKRLHFLFDNRSCLSDGPFAKLTRGNCILKQIYLVVGNTVCFRRMELGDL